MCKRICHTLLHEAESGESAREKVKFIFVVSRSNLFPMHKLNTHTKTNNNNNVDENKVPRFQFPHMPIREFSHLKTFFDAMSK